MKVEESSTSERKSGEVFLAQHICVSPLIKLRCKQSLGIFIVFINSPFVIRLNGVTSNDNILKQLINSYLVRFCKFIWYHFRIADLNRVLGY